MGIDAVLGFGAKALKSLQKQLAIDRSELGAGLVGSDRAAQDLDWLQPFHQGRRQQVIHHRPCRQVRWAGTQQP